MEDSENAEELVLPAFLCDRQPSLGFTMQRGREKQARGTNTYHPQALGILGRSVRRGPRVDQLPQSPGLIIKSSPKEWAAGKFSEADVAPIVMAESKQRAVLVPAVCGIRQRRDKRIAQVTF